jgi:hypothetical protein
VLIESDETEERVFYSSTFDITPNILILCLHMGWQVSTWGALLLLASDDSVERGLYGLGTALTCFYAFSSAVEQYM